jgi:hypothetical protein
MTLVASIAAIEPSTTESESVSESDLLDVSTSSSWLEEREALISYVSGLYSGVSKPVQTFLRSNSDLAWVLIGARAAISRAFGAATVRLALVQDIDVPEPRAQLFGYIAPATGLTGAGEALDRFDNDWLLERSDQLAGLLSFDLDY